MKNLIRHTTRVGNLLWYGTVSLLVLLAVAITLTRVLLPVLDDHRKQVEEWVSQFIGQPVTISTLDARVLGLAPSLILDDVALMSADGDHPIARFDGIHLSLDLINSLLERQLVLKELTVLGARLELIKQRDGSYRVQDIAIPSDPAISRDTEDSSAVMGWLFSQGRLAIKDSHLLWRDLQHDRTLGFDNVNLEFENDGESHCLIADIELPLQLGTGINLAMHFQGPAEDPASWQGDVYLKVTGLQPVNLLSNPQFKEWRMSDGRVGLELWGRWESNHLQRLLGTVEMQSLALNRGGQSGHVDRLSGRMLWQQQVQGWRLDLDQLVLGGEEESSEPAQLSVEHRSEEGSVTTLQANRINLAGWASLASLATPADKGGAELPDKLQPRGEIGDLRIQLEQGTATSVQAAFKGIGFNARERIPGLMGATGRLSWHQDVGEIHLDSQDLVVQLPRLFRDPLELTRLTGVLSFATSSDGWIVSGENIVLANNDIQGEVALAVSRQAGASPLVELKGNYRDGNAKSVPRYLPVGIMPPRVVSWLDQAFQAGRVVSGDVIFNGRGNEPFRNGPGLFRVNFQTEGVELVYHPEWPSLTNISAEAVFEGAGMAIKASSAKLLRSDIGATEVAIQDFTKARLLVNGIGKLANDDAFRLLRETQLANMGGNVTEGMAITGETGVGIKLDIPLSAAMSKSRPLMAAGRIHFNNNRITLAQGIAINQLNGDLSFNNADFSATGIDAEMLGGPVKIDVTSDKAGFTAVTAQGQVTAEGLRQELSYPFLERVSGSSDWLGKLTIARGQSELKITSDLQGLEVSLPKPVSKGVAEKKPLQFDIGLAGKGKGEISINYGDVLAVVLALSDQPDKAIQRGTVHFGSRRPKLSERRSLRFTGSQTELDLSSWLALFSAHGGQGRGLPIEVAMERLHLLPFHKVEGEGLNFSSLPPMDVVINHFAYHDVKLGQLRFASRSYSDSWQLDNLSLKGKGMKVSGSGRWQATPSGGNTTLELVLKSNHVGQFMKTVGFSSVITRGKGEANGKFSWQGRPNDFALARLNGNWSMAIKDGQMADVDPGAGRLLGLFSLDALPQRLALDFSDMTEEGMAFSEMKGDMEIRNGDAYTDNLIMKSNAANILVTGRTGLARRDYDQVINVAPNVSDTAAIASSFVWGPYVAATLLVMQRVFKSNIFGGVIIIQYQVTGSWDKPLIERVKLEEESEANAWE